MVNAPPLATLLAPSRTGQSNPSTCKMYSGQSRFVAPSPTTVKTPLLGTLNENEAGVATKSPISARYVEHGLDGSKVRNAAQPMGLLDVLRQGQSRVTVTQAGPPALVKVNASKREATTRSPGQVFDTPQPDG